MNFKLTTALFMGLLFNHSIAQKEFPVWEQSIPGQLTSEKVKEYITGVKVHQVVEPTLKAYLASEDIATGVGVLICPGGGYKILAIDHEGYQVAEWLNSLGISAFVLKYRLPNDRIMKDKTIGPLQDAQKALRMLRKNASQWKLNPNNIGVIGFSAGGHLAATLSTQYDRKVYPNDPAISARPNFSILVYPVISMQEGLTHRGSKKSLLGPSPSETLVADFSNELQVNANTPPTLLIHSVDDKAVLIDNSLVYLEQLKTNKVPVELHAFSNGGHGYGLGKGGSHDMWTQNAESWLKMILKK